MDLKSSGPVPAQDSLAVLKIWGGSLRQIHARPQRRRARHRRLPIERNVRRCRDDFYQAYPILKSTARLPSLPTANSRLATMPCSGLRTYCTPAPTLGNRSDVEQPLRSPPYRQATPPKSVAVHRSANRCRSSISIEDIDLPRYSPTV